jgi:hypothetical protein
VTVKFAWGPLAKGGPPAPLVEMTLSRGYRIRSIKGLFDSGADHACLNLEWKDRLRVPDSDCFDLDLTGICGKDHPVKGLATVLDATFDGHAVRLPLAFVAELPTDLFGRFGLLECWTALLDPLARVTTFEWVTDNTPMGTTFEGHWKSEVAKKKASAV